MIKKYLIATVLPFLICINLNTVLSLPRLLYYGLSTYTCLRAINAKESSTKIESSVFYFLLTCAITYYDYAKYQRFLLAPDKINGAYIALNNKISNILKEIVDKKEKNKEIRTALSSFEWDLLRNNPQHLDSPPIVFGANSLYNSHNRHILTSNDYSVEYDERDGYRFTDPNRIIDEDRVVTYKPIERKKHALDLLPEPQTHRNKFILTLGVSAIPLCFAAYTVIKNQTKK